jgi:hypothetical protein
MKKGQQPRVAKPELLAFCVSYGPVPQGIEEPTTNRLVVGWNPTPVRQIKQPH